MKNLLLYIILFAQPCVSQVIKFQNVGVSDKPMPTIEVYLLNSKDTIFIEKPVPYKKVPLACIVDEETFLALKEYSFTNKTNYNKGRGLFGSYRIIYSYAEQNLEEYVLKSYTESIPFFEKLLPLTKSYEKLFRFINTLIIRLKESEIKH